MCVSAYPTSHRRLKPRELLTSPRPGFVGNVGAGFVGHGCRTSRRVGGSACGEWVPLGVPEEDCESSLVRRAGNRERNAARPGMDDRPSRGCGAVLEAQMRSVLSSLALAGRTRPFKSDPAMNCWATVRTSLWHQDAHKPTCPTTGS